jgi:hypothetical protein
VVTTGLVVVLQDHHRLAAEFLSVFVTPFASATDVGGSDQSGIVQPVGVLLALANPDDLVGGSGAKLWQPIEQSIVAGDMLDVPAPFWLAVVPQAVWGALHEAWLAILGANDLEDQAAIGTVIGIRGADVLPRRHLASGAIAWLRIRPGRLPWRQWGAASCQPPHLDIAAAAAGLVVSENAGGRLDALAPLVAEADVVAAAQRLVRRAP